MSFGDDGLVPRPQDSASHGRTQSAGATVNNDGNKCFLLYALTLNFLPPAFYPRQNTRSIPFPHNPPSPSENSGATSIEGAMAALNWNDSQRVQLSIEVQRYVHVSGCTLHTQCSRPNI